MIGYGDSKAKKKFFFPLFFFFPFGRGYAPLWIFSFAVTVIEVASLPIKSNIVSGQYIIVQ